MAPSKRCRSGARFATRVALLIAVSGCSEVLGAHFGDAKLKPIDTDGGKSSGGETPQEVENLAAPPAAQQTSANFGYTIAMDETTLVVTAPFQDVDTPTGTKARGGATYVYDLGDLAAQPLALPVPNLDAEDGAIPLEIVAPGFGLQGDVGSLRVALNNEVIAVGNPAEDSSDEGNPSDNGATESGAVYVYDRKDLNGTPQYLKAPRPSMNAVFGEYLALSDTRLVVGAPGESMRAGAVYIFERKNGRFEEPPFRLAPDGIHPEDAFGMSVAIEGDLLVVGATGDSARGTGPSADREDTSADFYASGAVYVFRFKDGAWDLAQYVKPEVATPKGLFGWTVSLSGGRFAVGVPSASACPDSGAEAVHGASYIVEQSSSGWSEQCLASASVVGLFGWNVALSEEHLWVSDPWDSSGDPGNPQDDSVALAGAAHLYEHTPSGAWEHRAYVKAQDIEASAWLGLSMALSPDRIALGEPQVANGGGVLLFALSEPSK